MKKATIHSLFRSLIAGFAIYCVAYTVQGQMTTIQLPTNDNTSGFEVTKSNGSSVLKVDGTGRITGDASGMSYAKPLINYSQGNSSYYMTSNYGDWDNVREVTLTVPGPGIVWTHATGTLDWESKEWDLFYGGILGSHEGNPNNDWSADNTIWSHNMIVTDYACADSSDQYTGFATQRCIPVSSAGTYTFTLWGCKYTTSSLVRMHDACVVAMYFPTGGTGKPALREEEYRNEPRHELPDPRL